MPRRTHIDLARTTYDVPRPPRQQRWIAGAKAVLVDCDPKTKNIDPAKIEAAITDKTKAIAALSAPFDKGGATKLYDAAFQAVDDTGVQSNYRRAVIVATDGADNASVRTQADVTSNALNRNVPIFAIGIGSAINRTTLEQLAADTGGLYFEANTSQNLATIYQQISSILHAKQYVLKFDRLPSGAGASASSLTVGVSGLGLTGNAATSLASCS